MLLTGTKKCVRCGKDNEWEIHKPDYINSNKLPDVETYDENKVHPIRIANPKEDEYIFQFRCKYCDMLNRFTYHYEEYL